MYTDALYRFHPGAMAESGCFPQSLPTSVPVITPLVGLHLHTLQTTKLSRRACRYKAI